MGRVAEIRSGEIAWTIDGYLRQNGMITGNGQYGIYFTQIIDLVKEQPTAYDTDKVMEQLKGLHEGYKYTGNEFQRGAKAGAHYVSNRAIEIVKGGGVNG